MKERGREERRKTERWGKERLQEAGLVTLLSILNSSVMFPFVGDGTVWKVRTGVYVRLEKVFLH